MKAFSPLSLNTSSDTRLINIKQSTSTQTETENGMASLRAERQRLLQCCLHSASLASNLPWLLKLLVRFARITCKPKEKAMPGNSDERGNSLERFQPLRCDSGPAREYRLAG